MEELHRYFNILLKHFNLDEPMELNKIFINRIKIKSGVNFIKKLESIKDQVYGNIQKWLTSNEPNVDINTLKIDYNFDTMNITFTKDTYLDLLPNELLNLIASYTSVISRGLYGYHLYGYHYIDIFKLDDFVAAINRNFIDYNQIVSFMYPTLSRWLITKGKKITRVDFQRILQLNASFPRIITYLEDPQAVLPQNIFRPDYANIIKLRQQFPHFAGIEFESEFAKDALKLSSLNSNHILSQFLLTGKLSGTIDKIIIMYSVHFLYQLMLDPKFKEYHTQEFYMQSIIRLSENMDVFIAYISKLSKSEIMDVIKYIEKLSVFPRRNKIMNLLKYYS